ncbi:MAG: TRAP transporter small permease subunit [Pseudomonadota bacterium]
MATDYPTTAFSRWADGCIQRVGELTSYVWVVLLLVIATNVLMRYAFDQGRIEFEEIQWHLYSFGFLLGLSYAQQADAHVRVDLIHERLSLRHRAWIELYGIVLLLLPFIALILIYSVPFVADSWASGERSQAPGGLSQRWLVKALLPIGFALLLLSTLARLSRVWACLFPAPESRESPDPAADAR